MGTALIVGIFYCLDALLRRAPRSQHPVLEVAAGFRSHHRAREASIPLVILPLLSFAITLATQFIMLLLASTSIGWEAA